MECHAAPYENAAQMCTDLELSPGEGKNMLHHVFKSEESMCRKQLCEDSESGNSPTKEDWVRGS